MALGWWTRRITSIRPSSRPVFLSLQFAYSGHVCVYLKTRCASCVVSCGLCSVKSDVCNYTTLPHIHTAWSTQYTTWFFSPHMTMISRLAKLHGICKMHVLLQVQKGPMEPCWHGLCEQKRGPAASAGCWMPYMLVSRYLARLVLLRCCLYNVNQLSH